MRIVFFGANDIGWACLNNLIEMKHNIVGIFSIPKTFSISYSPEGVRNSAYRDFNSVAKQHCIPFRWVTSGKEYHVDLISKLNADIILVIGWYYMIPIEISRLTNNGVILVHASLLPKYRGGAPLTWAIIQGEKETGVSLFFLAEGIDNGDVIAQKKFLIEINDTILDVRNKAAVSTIELINESIPKLQAGKAQRIPQNEDEATFFPQRKPGDGLISWEKTSAELYNWVRAQTRPLPGAYTFWQKKPLYILDAIEKSERAVGKQEKPGTIMGIDQDGILVTCRKRSLLTIKTVNFADRCYSGREFFEKFVDSNRIMYFENS